MKKTLALLLTVVLLCTSLFTAIPVFATTENSAPISAIPLVGFTKGTYWSEVATHDLVMPEATQKFAIADGIKMTSATGAQQEFETFTGGKILATAIYDENTYTMPADFATNGSFIIYVKVDGANKMYFAARTDCPSGWYTTACLKAGADYKFAAIGDSAWTTATADENGIIDFAQAFEGYIKISVASLKSVDGVARTFKYLSQASLYFKGIGGDYGNIVAGPFFITTEDSTSTKITVPEEYRPQPINATPLTGYTASQVFDKVNVSLTMPEATKKFVTADGIKIISKTTAGYSYETTSASQILVRMGYDLTSAKLGYKLPADFKSKGSFIMYVKTDSANKMHWQFTTTWGATDGQTIGESAPNAAYEYAAIGSDEWTTAATDADGAFVFTEAFEGYVKIRTSSLECLDPYTMTFNFLGFMGIRFEGIGGDYGEIIAGPLFVTTEDSESTKITVPEEYRPQPINATPLTGYTASQVFDKVNVSLTMPEATKKFVTADGIKIISKTTAGYSYETTSASQILVRMGYDLTSAKLGYKLPADFKSKGSFIMYVKTDSANKMHWQFTTTWGATDGQTIGESAPNAAYEYAAIGSDEWTTAATDADGAFVFTEAFEGYVKIRTSSLECLDPYTMTFNFLGFMGIRFEGIGGDYGEIIAGPLFVTTEDSASTVITVDEQYAPKALDIKSFDFSEVRASGYDFSASKIESTNNYKLYIDEDALSDTPVKHADGVNKWSYVENEDGKVASGPVALVMTPTVATYMKDAIGMVFYVKFDKPNAFSPALTFDDNAGRTVMLKPGQKVQVLAKGSDEWVDKTVDVGVVNNGVENTAIYGMVSFDAAFEGYIKVPFTSCNNDGGFMNRLTLTGDNMSALTAVALRFKGIGDDTMYGKEVVAGVSGYYTEDTAKAEIGSIAAPDYAEGDVNYDWKVNSTDIVAASKSLLGIKGYAGYEVESILELIRLKKLLAAAE